MKKTINAARFKELESIAWRVLTRKGCSWCKKRSLKEWAKHIIGEARELEEALERRDFEEAAEELGDVMYVSILLGVCAQKQKKFKLESSLEAARAKIMRRHPQIWGNKKYASEDELWETYHAIKLLERVGKRWRHPAAHAAHAKRLSPKNFAHEPRPPSNKYFQAPQR